MYKDMNDENKRNWSKTILDYLQNLKKLMKHSHQEISVLWQRFIIFISSNKLYELLPR